MPALRGSLTYARFFVEGDLPDDFSGRFMKAIRHRAMKPLEPDSEELERSGWAKIGEPFVVELDHGDVFYNEYVNLSFRTDRWAIPGPMLKTKVRDAEQAYLQKKGREKLSRSEKKELKEMTAKKLRRQVDPATRAFDLSWSLNEGVVRFFSHAQKPAGLMTELFEKTFSLKLIPESPYTAAAKLGLSKAQEAAWQELEMIALGGPRERITDEAAEEE